MKKKALEKIERLLRITSHIEQIYDRLVILEKEGEKDSSAYQKTVDYLKNCIENEKEIYEREYNDFSENKEIIEYLEKECERVKKPIHCEDSILLENDFSNKVVQRIINRLLSKLSEKEETVDYIDEKHNVSEIGVDKIMQDDRMSKLVIYKKLISDIEKNIGNHNFKSYKNSLIEIKYDLAFVCDFFEESMIGTAFTSSKEEINLTEFQIVLSADLYSQAIDRLLEISDDDYREDENGVRTIILQSIIKSYLSLMSREKLLHNMEVFNSIESKEEDSDYRISEKIVLLSFKQALEEKENKEEKRI